MDHGHSDKQSDAMASRAIQACSTYEATTLSSWRDMVRGALNDIHCHSPGGGAFRGAISSWDLLDTRFVQISADAHRASFDQSRISKSDREFVLLSVLHEGEAKIFQDDREMTLFPGDIAIYDMSKPYQFVITKSFVQTVVRLHRDDLARRVPHLHDFTAHRIAGDKGVGRIASAHIREVYDQLDSVGPESARAVQVNLLNIIAYALSGPERGPSAFLREHHQYLLRRIHWFVEENLFDENLSCEGVAAALGISERYLRKVCSTSGYSLSERILNRRLEEASRRLSHQNAVRTPITSIAYDCGFKDAAHFSRAFKAKFGMTPRDYQNAPLDA